MAARSATVISASSSDMDLLPAMDSDAAVRHRMQGTNGTMARPFSNAIKAEKSEHQLPDFFASSAIRSASTMAMILFAFATTSPFHCILS